MSEKLLIVLGMFVFAGTFLGVLNYFYSLMHDLHDDPYFVEGGTVAQSPASGEV